MQLYTELSIYSAGFILVFAILCITTAKLILNYIQSLILTKSTVFQTEFYRIGKLYNSIPKLEISSYVLFALSGALFITFFVLLKKEK